MLMVNVSHLINLIPNKIKISEPGIKSNSGRLNDSNPCHWYLNSRRLNHSYNSGW